MECFLVVEGAVVVLLLELLADKIEVLEPFFEELPVLEGVRILGEGELAGFSQLEKKSSTLLFLEETAEFDPEERSPASSSVASTS